MFKENLKNKAKLLNNFSFTISKQHMRKINKLTSLRMTKLETTINSFR